MMIRLAALLSLMLLALSMLQFQSSQSMLLWKLTIVATEFGHWLAFAPLLLALALLSRRSRLAQIAIGAAILSAGLFLWPVTQMALHFSKWSQTLDADLGTHGFIEAEPSFGRLWFAHDKQVAPRPIIYSQATGLSFDYYPPADGSKQPAPWILVIHGGGWDSGDAKQLPELNSFLSGRGYGVISMDYRLAPKFRWPAPKEDVLQAVSYIKQNADAMGLDRTRWAILGRSAGGQIAEAFAYRAQDSSLKGCIALYAPTDLVFAYDHGLEDDMLGSRPLVRNYLGGEPHDLPDLYHDASPLELVTASTPPTLLFHGPRDPLVWYGHSERLYAKLRANGVAASLVMIPWGTHGFDYSLSGPGGQLCTYAIELFLRKVFA